MPEYTGRVAADVIWIEDKVLMARRVSDDTYEFVGGKEEVQDFKEDKEEPNDESIKNTALRELEEELGFYAEPIKVGESYPSATADLDILPVEMRYDGDLEDLRKEMEIGDEHSDHLLIQPEEIDEVDHRGQKRSLENLNII